MLLAAKSPRDIANALSSLPDDFPDEEVVAFIERCFAEKNEWAISYLVKAPLRRIEAVLAWLAPRTELSARYVTVLTSDASDVRAAFKRAVQTVVWGTPRLEEKPERTRLQKLGQKQDIADATVAALAGSADVNAGMLAIALSSGHADVLDALLPHIARAETHAPTLDALLAARRMAPAALHEFHARLEALLANRQSTSPLTAHLASLGIEATTMHAVWNRQTDTASLTLELDTGRSDWLRAHLWRRSGTSISAMRLVLPKTPAEIPRWVDALGFAWRPGKLRGTLKGRDRARLLAWLGQTS